MADRYFPNDLPSFVAEPAAEESAAAAAAGRGRDSLAELLHLPYKVLSERLKSAALELKDTVFNLNSLLCHSAPLDALLNFYGTYKVSYVFLACLRVHRSNRTMFACSILCLGFKILVCGECDSKNHFVLFIKLML